MIHYLLLCQKNMAVILSEEYDSNFVRYILLIYVQCIFNKATYDICFRLDSVAAFRAEIQKKTSQNIFEQLQQQSHQTPGSRHPAKRVKGQEMYPGPLRHQKRQDRRRNPRYKTLPINLHELGHISEIEALKPSVRSPGGETVKAADMTHDDRTDDIYDVLVEVDAQKLTKHRSDDSHIVPPDDPVSDSCQMSVGDKLSMFQRLDNEKSTARSSHARHLADRRNKLQRHRTQPVTEDEVKMAAVLATRQVNRSGASEKDTASGSDDELSKYAYFRNHLQP